MPAVFDGRLDGCGRRGGRGGDLRTDRGGPRRARGVEGGAARGRQADRGRRPKDYQRNPRPHFYPGPVAQRPGHRAPAGAIPRRMARTDPLDSRTLYAPVRRARQPPFHRQSAQAAATERNSAMPTQAHTTADTFDIELATDVLVIGGGPAGAWAALSAADEGASVVIA